MMMVEDGGEIMRVTLKLYKWLCLWQSNNNGVI